MRKTGNYYPKTYMRKLRLDSLNYSLSQGPLSSPLWYTQFDLIYLTNYLSRAQLTCVSVFLTQLSSEFLTRTNVAICSPSG